MVNSAIRGLLGALPTDSEYQRLMDPLYITNVSLAPGDPHKLRVAYRVNDIRLLKAFADTWEPAAKVAVSRILGSLAAYDTDPGSLSLADRNLNTSLLEGETYSGGKLGAGYLQGH